MQREAAEVYPPDDPPRPSRPKADLGLVSEKSGSFSGQTDATDATDIIQMLLMLLMLLMLPGSFCLILYMGVVRYTLLSSLRFHLATCLHNIILPFLSPILLHACMSKNREGI